MDRLGIIGAGWRRGGTESLGPFTLPADTRAERLPALKEALGVEELVYVATCNRVELLVVRPADPEELPPGVLRRRVFTELVGREPRPGEAEQALREWGGEGALEHLLLVACGLDSADLGEREIRGQLRDGHRLAQAAGVCGSRLDWAVGRALRVARQVAEDSGLADGSQSLAGLGIARVRERLAALPGPVALVGVSAMTERCGEALAAEGVPCVVVNRSAERGRGLASRLGFPYQSLFEFRACPGVFTAVVLATGASEPLLGRGELERLTAAAGHPPLVVDYGVPANADPRAAARLGVPRIGMQEISSEAEANRERRRGRAAAARERVDRALGELRGEFAERSTSPVLAELAQRFRDTARDGTARLFRRELKHLGDGERAAVEAFAVSLAKRFAHVPTLGLRALASEFGGDAVDTFLAASDAELAALRQGASMVAEPAANDREPGGAL
ncbi:MAG: hypothetical protein AAGN66_17625 [Acidobacteriota bacterium]